MNGCGVRLKGECCWENMPTHQVTQCVSNVRTLGLRQSLVQSPAPRLCLCSGSEPGPGLRGGDGGGGGGRQPGSSPGVPGTVCLLSPPTSGPVTF